MMIILPSVDVQEFDGKKMLDNIENAGRTCYKSESLTTQDSAEKFVRMILNRGHESVLEHESITVRVICDRGVTHEIVRHRIASYSQESTRYCDYGGDGIQVISMGNFLDKEQYEIWYEVMDCAEQAYLELRKLGVSPQFARSVLPNSLKTEIVMTMNLREWRHFMRLRTSKAAHPQMREVALMILKVFKKKIPVVFEEFKMD